MVLISNIDAVYLVLPKACSRATAWFVFCNDPNKTPNQIMNKIVHIMCNTIKNIIVSADYCKTGGLYMAGQRA